MSDFTATLDEARSYDAQNYAQNSRLAYANDWKLFKVWCVTRAIASKTVSLCRIQRIFPRGWRRFTGASPA
jgi:hypothetical protein